MERFPMTPQCKERLKGELDHLKSVERPAVVNAIEVAREHGDLKENAEYHAAKDKQGWIEARIRILEAKISRAEVIDPTSLSGDIVRFGATVTLLDGDTEEEVVYSIVGEDESDVKRGFLNFKSPIARGILGKEDGDDVEIRTTGGLRAFEILKVEYKALDTSPVDNEESNAD